MEQKTEKKLDYKWVIVALSFLMVMICMGFCSSNKGMYLKSITQALNIPRSKFAISDTCRYVTTTVVNLFFSALVFRFGEKKLIIAGIGSLIVSTLLYATATQAYMFWIGGMFLGIGLSWTNTTMVGYVVGKWCKEHKGKIMGLVMAANGLGGAIAARIVAPMINGSEFGYRSAYYMVVGILIVLDVIILLFFRNAPGERVKGDVPRKKARGAGWTGVSFEEAVKMPQLYLAALCVFATGVSLQGLVGINSAHMKDVGIDPLYVDGIVVVAHSVTLALCKFLAGLSFDAIGLKKTMIICNVAALASILLLIGVSPTESGRYIAMAYGIISSFALPLETIMIPLIVSDLFGEKSYAKLLGIFVSVSTAGFAISSPLTNFIYDRYGSYLPILYVLLVIMFIVAIAFQLILRSADRRKKEILNA